jgi:flagellar protein FliO/FliZ
MMLWYILKLVIVIVVVSVMAYGSLWLWRRVQPGMAFTQRERMVKLVDAIPLGATGKLAVVDFAGKRLLLAVSRTGVTLVSETEAVDAQGA